MGGPTLGTVEVLQEPTAWAGGRARAGAGRAFLSLPSRAWGSTAGVELRQLAAAAWSGLPPWHGGPALAAAAVGAVVRS